MRNRVLVTLDEPGFYKTTLKREGMPVTPVSARIQQLCDERGITVGKLCTIAGTTGSTVHDIVSGVTKNSRVLTLKRLCDALGITLSEFFDAPEFNSMDELD